MTRLNDLYDALLENPYQIFIQFPDGHLGARHEIRRLALSDDTDWFGAFTVYPGSFNPLHAAHRAMFDNSAPKNHTCKVFEISICRVGKQPLSVEELAERLQQFIGYAPIIVTNAALFTEKCAVLSTLDTNVTARFIVGMDTYQRMIDAYGQLGLVGLRGEFVVFDRILNGKKMSLDPSVHILCVNVDRSDYQLPEELQEVSSTKIRNGEIKP